MNTARQREALNPAPFVSYAVLAFPLGTRSMPRLPARAAGHPTGEPGTGPSCSALFGLPGVPPTPAHTFM